MNFSGKDIENKCSRMCLLNGKALYASKAVESFQVYHSADMTREWITEHMGEMPALMSDDDIDELIEMGDLILMGADVRDTQDYPVVTYHASVLIDDSAEEKILASYCDCEDHKNGEKMCRHCVAVAHNFVMDNLERQLSSRLESSAGDSADDVGTASGGSGRNFSAAAGRESSAAVQSLIHRFSGVEHYEHSREEVGLSQWGNIHIYPNICLESHGRPVLEFRIGTDKNKYIIKNLGEFLTLVDTGAFHSYGKKLAFAHDESRFDEKSRALISIMRDVRDFSRDISDSIYGRWSRNLNPRYLQISGHYLEEFLEYCDGSVSVNGLTYDLVDRNPDMEMRIEPVSGGANIVVPSVKIMHGDVHCFLVPPDERVIYRVSDGFAKNAVPVLETIISNSYWYDRGYITGGKNEVSAFLGQRDYSRFCGYVLRRVTRYFDVGRQGEALEKYMPPECQISFFVDSDEHNALTCRMKAAYGSDVYDPANSFDTGRGEFRDLEMEQQAYRAARRYFNEEELNGGQHVLVCRDEDMMYELIDRGINDLSQYGEVLVSDSIKKIQVRPSPRVNIGVRVSSDLLALDVDIPDMDMKEIDDIMNAYREKKHYYRMKNGDFMRLQGSGVSTIDELTQGMDLKDSDWQNGEMQLPLYFASYIDSTARDTHHVSVHRASSFKSVIRDMKEVEDSDFEIPEGVKAELRGYQKTGFRWLRTLYHYRFGGILADDMGLGKTLQMLSLIASLVEDDNYNRAENTALIVCPASLVYNWQSECEKFTPEIRTLLITGNVSERRDKMSDLSGVDLVITSYDLLKRDVEEYRDLNFSVMAIDEAQYIKNASTQVARSVKKVRAGVRFAMSGTPIENRLSDLWSIFDFLMPGYLLSYKHFRERYENPIVNGHDQGAMDRLQKMIRPFLLRRRKADVLTDLPDKIEHVVYTSMTEEQRKIYNARFNQLRNELLHTDGASFNRQRMQILSELTRLRQTCCDPALYLENYDGGSGKEDALLSMAEELTENGSSVLVFSQFASMLSILKEDLEARNIRVLMLTGQNSKEERRRMVEEFQTGSSIVFLISLKAGGTGLNLTAADTVIHYDPWWNVAAQNQATDRAHRIGQDKVVTVIQLVCKDSIEEKIRKLQDQKKELVESVVETGAGDGHPVTREELIELMS